ncbi:MAG: DUF4143 domain-containing protein [Spirochaetales bacterium]|nr:DUF4143 domain-containing protein [Spirochaetales bacterium]
MDYIDEIQRKPEMFPILRILWDRQEFPSRFLILGSASPRIIKSVSESLAGRIGFIELGGFNITETGPGKMHRLWMNGGFPRSFLAENTELSLRWRNDFIRTFLERDIPQLGISIPSATLRRFWTMVAHSHGQVLNIAESARSLGTAENTARRYLELLCGTFVVRQIAPWFENIKKRQIKSPKIYIRDSGLLHALLQINNRDALLGHPKYGASWEGFALEQVLSIIRPDDFYFWGTRNGAELDLLIMRNGKRYGFEFKAADAPSTTKSMHSAIATLSLEKLFICYPGDKDYSLTDKIEVISMEGMTGRFNSLPPTTTA